MATNVNKIEFREAERLADLVRRLPASIAAPVRRCVATLMTSDVRRQAVRDRSGFGGNLTQILRVTGVVVIPFQCSPCGSHFYYFVFDFFPLFLSG